MTKITRQFGIIPSLVFYHIPVYEYRKTLDYFWTSQCKGMVAEWDIAYQLQDEGFFRLLYEFGVVKVRFINVWTQPIARLALAVALMLFK